jgi:hypothetical protein
VTIGGDVQIRLSGTHEEIRAVLTALAPVLDIREASDFYPNNRRGGISRLGRVYLDVTTPDSKPTEGT